FSPRHDLKVDASRLEALLGFGDQRQHFGSPVGERAGIHHVRRRYHHPDAVRNGDPGHGQRLVPGLSPVVDPRQDVAVKVDHSPVAARWYRRSASVTASPGTYTSYP